MAALEDLTSIVTKLSADFETYKAAQANEAAAIAAAVAAQKAADDAAAAQEEAALTGQVSALASLDTLIVAATPPAPAP